MEVKIKTDPNGGGDKKPPVAVSISGDFPEKRNGPGYKCRICNKVFSGPCLLRGICKGCNNIEGDIIGNV